MTNQTTDVQALTDRIEAQQSHIRELQAKNGELNTQLTHVLQRLEDVQGYRDYVISLRLFGAVILSHSDLNKELYEQELGREFTSEFARELTLRTLHLTDLPLSDKDHAALKATLQDAIENMPCPNDPA